MNKKYDVSSIYKSVTKPGRYSAGEFGQIIKDKNDIKARFAFCFPDSYEIGMSNLGVQILYGSLNKEKDIWCERAYTPWPDMQERMSEYGLTLCAHESGDPLSEFDIVAFTLQYEMCYTNVLTMLKLAGIPLRSKDRGEDAPIIIGGGPCSYNPEPIADFFDCFSIGEGEESLVEFTELYIRMKEDGSYSRSAFLREAAKLGQGIYVPSLYDVEYNADGTVKAYTPVCDDIPTRVTKTIIKDMDKAFYPENVVVPNIEAVQERIMLEVYRGCIRGCRFCQAGIVYRPVREKSPDVLCRQAKCLFENTGFEEISLSSLSISDYSRLPELTDGLINWSNENMINLSLPSLRIDSFSKSLMDRVRSVRSSSLTFAPEAGTQRLRDVINKNVTEEDLLRAVNVAFDAGKTTVKLYFMMGLPTETDEDIEGIALLAKKVLDSFYANPNRNRAKAPQVTISVACLVPKPFTPFQWEPQTTMAELERKQQLLASKITDRKIKYNFHDAGVSFIEAVLAKGDRRMSDALELACEEGFMFDAWTEYFDYDRWVDVFERSGIDMAFYAHRKAGDDEIFPWDVIDCGVEKRFLLSEKQKAYAETTTKCCREACSGCGANKLGGEKTWCPTLPNPLKK